ncbi:hypothetical protein ACQP1U_01015 [Actinomycetota bacterium]
MDTTILQHINQDIAAGLTEASRADLSRPSTDGVTGAQICDELMSEHRRLITEILGLGNPQRNWDEQPARPAADDDGRAAGEQAAADFRRSAHALERAIVGATHPDAASRYAEHTLVAMAAARRLDAVLGFE